ncbi:MAG: hypothetical protein M3Y41_05170, partial [Pseudomonadota bacterium]|nr:hypothetical protein [Pseudomonadota bacterium]
RFDRPLEDLFAVQDELADRIAALVESQIGRESLRRARRRAPASFSAYEWLLHGRDRLGRSTEADAGAAGTMLDRAIGADGGYALAYAWRSMVAQWGFTLGWGELRGRAALDLALELARRAAALEPGSSLCLMRVAFALSLLGRDDEAVESGRQGVRANPCDATSRHAHGEILSRAGLHAAGVAELRRAMSLNPFHPPYWRATVGRALLLAGQHDEALTELRLAAALAPDYRPVHSSLVVTLVEADRMDAACASMREVLRLRPGWSISRYDDEFGLRRPADTMRFLAAFRAAGMPEH